MENTILHFIIHIDRTHSIPGVDMCVLLRSIWLNVLTCIFILNKKYPSELEKQFITRRAYLLIYL